MQEKSSDKLEEQLGFKEKFFVIFLIELIIMGPYFLLQRYNIINHVIVIPELAIDRLITFHENFFWVYQSLYVLLLMVGFSIKIKTNFLAFSNGIMTVGIVCNLFFFLFPTMCPRQVIEGTSSIYNLFTKMELPLNAFPSMHVAMAVFTAIFCFKNQKHVPVKPYIISIWATLIVTSTLFLKQHYFIDVLGGACVAVLVYKLKLEPLKIIYFKKSKHRLPSISE